MGRLLFFQSKEKPSFPHTWDERFRVATQIILPPISLAKVISQSIIKDTTLSARHRLCVGKHSPTGKRTDFLSSPAFTKRRLSAQASEILFFLSLLHYSIMDYYITFFTLFQFFFKIVKLFHIHLYKLYDLKIIHILGHIDCFLLFVTKSNKRFALNNLFNISIAAFSAVHCIDHKTRIVLIKHCKCKA